MNLRLAILIASLTVNALLIAVVVRSWPARRPAPVTPLPAARPPEASVPEPPRSEPITVAASESVGAPAAFHWRELEAKDYKSYIAHLRAFGVPERIIRDIIIGDVERLYRPRLAALRPPRREIKYWEQYNSISSRAGQTRVQREQERALIKEKSEFIKDLLGSDVFEQVNKDLGRPDSKQQIWGALAEEKRAPADKMWEKFQEAQRSILEKSDFNDMERDLRELSRKFKADLATVLTPQEIEDFELRSSDIANLMRFRLTHFTPDEAEFRAVFRYKQAMEDLESASSPDAIRPESQAMALMQEQRKQAEAALAEVLSPERLKDYRVSDDFALSRLFDLGLDRDGVLKVADMKKSAEEAVASLREDKSLSTEQRTAALNAIQAETERELGALIGDRKLKYYRRSGGSWLRNLAPSPPP